MNMTATGDNNNVNIFYKTTITASATKTHKKNINKKTLMGFDTVKITLVSYG